MYTNITVENSTYHDHLHPAVSHEQRLICGVLFLVITAAGIFGNVFVIFAVFASKRLQTFTNMFIVNLSVADLLSCILMQFQVRMMVGGDHEAYPFSQFACGLIASSLCTTCGCSIYTLASIGLYRLVLLTDKKGQRADRLKTIPCAILWIGLTWIIPLLVNIVTSTYASETFGYNEKYRVCGAQSEIGNNHEIEIAQVFGLYTVALVIIVMSYGWIFFYIHRLTMDTLWKMDSDIDAQNNSIFRNWRTASASNSFLWSRTASNSSQTENARQLFRREITITKNMFFVVIAFMICVTPYSLCLIVQEWNGLLYTAIPLMLNSCINPVLYGFKHPHFRKVFKCLLTCHWKLVPKPSDAFRTLSKLCIKLH